METSTPSVKSTEPAPSTSREALASEAFENPHHPPQFPAFKFGDPRAPSIPTDILDSASGGFPGQHSEYDHTMPARLEAQRAGPSPPRINELEVLPNPRKCGLLFRSSRFLEWTCWPWGSRPYNLHPWPSYAFCHQGPQNHNETHRYRSAAERYVHTVPIEFDTGSSWRAHHPTIALDSEGRAHTGEDSNWWPPKRRFD